MEQQEDPKERDDRLNDSVQHASTFASTVAGTQCLASTRKERQGGDLLPVS